ncbi:glutamate synthase [NADPH] large chain [Sporolactobacillus inulinus]|nr:glutamate synthase [NADPH] large chain [Sporolactobacillus inulinus]
MTGGKVVVLGSIGRNFAAGMSGGIAYILPDGAPDQTIHRINKDMVNIEPLTDQKEQAEVYELIKNHLDHTGSPKAEQALINWKTSIQRIIKIIPRDYEAMLEQIERYEAQGLDAEQAQEEAFYLKKEGKLSVRTSTYLTV